MLDLGKASLLRSGAPEGLLRAPPQACRHTATVCSPRPCNRRQTGWSPYLQIPYHLASGIGLLLCLECI